MRRHYGKGLYTRAVKVDAYGEVSFHYLAPHGAKDPIGRLLTQIELEIILDWLSDPQNLATCISGFYQQAREKFPSLHKYPDKFLKDIQQWHDNDDNWDDKGISAQGWKVLDEIESKILRMQK